MSQSAAFASEGGNRSGPHHQACGLFHGAKVLAYPGGHHGGRQSPTTVSLSAQDASARHCRAFALLGAVIVQQVQLGRIAKERDVLTKMSREMRDYIELHRPPSPKIPTMPVDESPALTGR